MKHKTVRYYTSFTDDFEHTAAQEYTLPADYAWVRTSCGARFLSALIYAVAVVCSTVYCRLVLHMRVKGRRCLKGLRGGFFLYGNHTQPVGDVFIPALCVWPRRIVTVVSTANYGIPVIGKLLPYLGALPVEETLRGMKELQKAMDHHLTKGHPIVIYPEAHVWEYYTGIRPFPTTSFRFPVKRGCPVIAMTVTYRRSRWFRRPLMEVFLDGPFYPEGHTASEKAASLHDRVYNTMKKRSCHSDVQYIPYAQKKQE